MVSYGQVIVINGQTPDTVLVTEEETLEITTSYLDITYVGTESLSVQAAGGENYTVSENNRITPDDDYNGLLSVPVFVSDGTASDSYDFQILVTPVNDAPALDVIENVAVAEDAPPQQISLTGISAGPSESQELLVSATSDNADLFSVFERVYTSPESTATLNIQPQANAWGTATVTVTVTDDGGNTPPDVNTFSRTFVIDVTPVNDPPAFDAIEDLILAENTGTQTVSVTGIDSGPLEDQPLTITAISDNTGLIPHPSVMYDGTSAATLTFSPQPGVEGTAIITVRVVDSESAEFTRTFTVTVEGINDPPTLDAISDITNEEDAPQQAITLTGISAGLNESQGLSVAATSDNPTLFYVLEVVYTSPGIAGTLNIMPATDMTGSALVTVTVTDDGVNVPPGINAFSRTFTVTVTPVNDAPVIVSQAQAISITEGGSILLTTDILTVSDPDNSTHDLTVLPGSDYTFSGTTVSPVENFEGTLTVNVQVGDGELVSETFGVLVTVQPVNDAPVITDHVPLSVEEDNSITLQLEDLIVEDPDNVYPEDFSIIVSPLSHCTVNGLVITPDADYTGVVSVAVVVNDGVLSSNEYTMNIPVTPVNDPPHITGQTPLAINEDHSIVLQLSHLSISDPDNTGDFTLSVSPGNHYSVSGTTITPDLNFFGQLSIPVRVSDGSDTSDPYDLLVNVAPVNDVPQIIGQIPISVGESEPVVITISHLSVFDPDDTYPDDFTVTVAGGENYSLVQHTVTPVAGFSGVLQVPVRVSDGEDVSLPFTLQILVNFVNDPPVIVSQKTSISVDEEKSVALEVTHLAIADPDNSYPDDFTLVVLPGVNYTFSGRTVAPAENFNGKLSVAVSVSDGLSNSAPFIMQIDVLPVNDAPVITGQNAISTGEDQPLMLQFSHLTVDDPDDEYPVGFTIVALPGSNYVVSGSTITPANDYSGSLTVPVQVIDAGGLRSNTFNLQVKVSEGNDAPVITGQQPLPLVGTEDHPVDLGFSNLLVTDSDDTYPTGFSIVVQPGVNYTVSGNTVIPANDFSGILSVKVRVNDGTSSSGIFNLQIRIDEVNDAPSLNPIGDISVLEDADVQHIALSGISPGPKESQAVKVSASSSNPDMFGIFDVFYQSPETSGTLRIKAKNDAFGVAAITVNVTDDGSNTLPNVNSITRTFLFTVTPVNDAPVFTSTPATFAVAGEVYEYIVAVSDADASDVVSVTALQKPSWLTLSTNGPLRLAGTPPEGSGGSYPVKLQAKDPSGATALQEYLLWVNTRPVVYDFTVTLKEDATAVIDGRKFDAAFSDADKNPVEMIRVSLPKRGNLMLDGQAVSDGAEIDATSLAGLQYKPYTDFYGKDTINWNGFDGHNYAIMNAKILIEVDPVNDAPVITEIETDVLDYFVGTGPGIISAKFDVTDIDDDSLMSAEIGFRRQNFVSNEDLLVFESVSTIKGSYDPVSGILALTGQASVADYAAAIRLVRYDNVAETFSAEEVEKTIFYTVSDGKAFSMTRDRIINVIDAFVDLVIPSGFTPNNDNANDTWIIENIRAYPDVSVKIYNVRGVLVFASEGYEAGWDGTHNGDPLPTDSYYYTIDLNLPVRKKSYKGSVTILR